jgi:DNA repair protein RadC
VLTPELHAAAKLVGLKLEDHLIIGAKDISSALR